MAKTLKLNLKPLGDRVVVETDKGSLPLRIAALVYQPEASLMQG